MSSFDKSQLKFERQHNAARIAAGSMTVALINKCQDPNKPINYEALKNVYKNIFDKIKNVN